MKKYKVTVNGNTYEIELEVIDAAEAKNAPVKTVEAEKPAVASAEPTNAAPAPADGEKIVSFMPGNILAVNVKDGQSVQKGDVLFILEAMKMENEIMAPCDGTVASVSVNVGATVETGELLCIIK